MNVVNKGDYMTKILFLIHDLGQGGAEKVLVNLVNNMDHTKFDITVISLFGGGVNEKFLSPKVKYKTVFSRMIPGNSKWMKLMSPRQLHRLCVKESYDIEVAYLEGPAVRVVSGCSNENTKKVAWIHCTMHSEKDIASSFRSYKEADKCYRSMDNIVCVSSEVEKAFIQHCPSCSGKSIVLYNTNESDKIIEMSGKQVDDVDLSDNLFKWCGVGKLVPLKGFDRMLNIQKRLIDEEYASHLFILGIGPQKEELEDFCERNNISDSVTFLGYQKNPYKYISKCDLYACASHSEGFSTAATEALIVGTPVCTVEVSGMKEMLGNNNEYGIVTENSEEALYEGIKQLLDDPDLLKHYTDKAEERGKFFSTENTVRAVEEMLLSL